MHHRGPSMAAFTVIDEAKAPKRAATTPASLHRRMQEYEGYVTALKKGQAGKLVPGEGESLRSLVLRISRAGKRAGKPVESWTTADAVYFMTR